MSKSRLLWPVIGLLLVGALTLWTAKNIEVESDITHFLPEGSADQDLELARNLAFGELSRTMLLIVSVDAESDAAAISSEFEAELRAEPALADQLEFLDGGPTPGIERDIWQLFEPRRFGFLAADAGAARELTTTAGLERTARELVAELASPLSTLVARVAPSDPFMILPRLLERLEAARGSDLEVRAGRFVVDDGRSAVLFLGTRSASSNNVVQRPILAAIASAFERVDERHGGSLTLAQSGANRYGIAMERDIRADIQRVTIGSALMLAALFWLLLRSLRLFVLVLPVLGTGFVVGTATCVALFGSVHAMTLAFGSALIGVSVDYAVHFHVHHVVDPHPRGPGATLRSIWPGLALSAATTVVAFLALALSSFPGLRELAVFAAAGVTAALLATVVFLPSLASRTPRAHTARALAAWFDRTLFGARAARWRWPARAVGVVAIGLVAYGLPRVRWEDGIAGLNRLDPQLLAEDAAVRERVTRFDQRCIAVAVAEDEEAALVVNDRLGAVLERAQHDGRVEGYWSASIFLPSASRQRAVDGVLREDPELWSRMRVALEGAGLVAAGFEPFTSALAEPAPAPLRPSDIAGTSLAGLLRPLRMELPGRVAFISYVRGAKDRDALTAPIEAAGGHWIDVEGELSSAYRDYRVRMTRLCLIGIALVIALVFARHVVTPARAGANRWLGALRATTLACTPALLAAATTLAVFGALDRPLNLLSLVALLMVVSMGVDYGVLSVESTRQRDHPGTTYLSVVLAAVSTIFGFGLLALSVQTALSGIGAAAGLGILLALAFVTILRLAMPEPLKVLE